MAVYTGGEMIVTLVAGVFMGIALWYWLDRTTKDLPRVDPR